VTDNESPETTFIAVNTCLQSKVPAVKAFNNPDSVTATVPVTAKVLATCAVSLVTVVVTCEAEPLARVKPLVVDSVPSVVSVTADAVVPVCK